MTTVCGHGVKVDVQNGLEGGPAEAAVPTQTSEKATAALLHFIVPVPIHPPHFCSALVHESPVHCPSVHCGPPHCRRWTT